MINRRHFLSGIVGLGISMLLPATALAVSYIRNAFSPRNKKRKRRKSTRYIILHTTEAANSSSFRRVKRYGLANYLVQTDGKVLRIIDKHKVARHAGRSMWNGLSNLDRYSVGIEVVGYHNKPITRSQIRSLKQLIRELQSVYKIKDQNVIPHSMVAYGAPNRWHKSPHRGRKRCGMQFANTSLRKKLGLTAAPQFDPDVSSGRLVVADRFLDNILFPGKGTGKSSGHNVIAVADIGNVVKKGVSPWAIAKGAYNSPDTIYTFPSGKTVQGNKIKNWSNIPVGTKVTIKTDSYQAEESDYQILEGKDTAWDVAGKAYRSKTTVYFMPNGMIRRGDEISKRMLNNLPRKTKVFVGYLYGGKVKPGRSAYKIAGSKWDDDSTMYRLPSGQFVSGDDITQNKIPLGTIILYRV